MRRDNDAYYTPTEALLPLVLHVPELRRARVLEPCSGGHALSDGLRAHGCDVRTNDLDPKCHADSNADAAWSRSWEASGPLGPRRQWVVTNPPFLKALPILLEALQWATEGVAFLLRLSFLEPTDDRGVVLGVQPPSDLIVIPRISFTGDGHTDQVTCAWMVWQKDRPSGRRSIVVVPKHVMSSPPSDGTTQLSLV